MSYLKADKPPPAPTREESPEVAEARRKLMAREAARRQANLTLLTSPTPGSGTVDPLTGNKTLLGE